MLGTLYVVPRALVSLLQRGATARVTAQMAATNPHPVVGVLRGAFPLHLLLTDCHAERFLFQLCCRFFSP